MQRLRRFFALLLCLFQLVALCPAQAATDSVIVRVACPDYPSFLSLRDGIPYGYAAAWLERIAHYTGWQYEYVPMSLHEAQTALATGEIDLVPGLTQRTDLGTTADWPALSMGTDSAVIACRREDDRWAYDDFPDYSGMRLGVVQGEPRLTAFMQRMAVYSANTTVITYKSDAECKAALASGEVDTLLMSSIRCNATVKILSRLESSALYIACSTAKPFLAEGVNSAQDAIYGLEPFLELDLSEKYYGGDLTALALTTQESAYLKTLNHLDVGVLTGCYGLMSEKDGELTGIMPPLLSLLSERLGIPFVYHRVSTVSELMAGLQSGAWQLIAPLLCSELSCVDDLCQPLSTMLDTSLSMICRRNDSEHELSQATVALQQDCSVLEAGLLSAYPSATLTYFATVEEALLAVQDGRADFALCNSIVARQLLESPRLDTLTLYPVFSQSEALTCAAALSASPLLVSALNKAISSFTAGEVETIQLSAMYASGYEMTLSDYLYRFRTTLILIAALIACAIATVSLLLVNRRRALETEQALTEQFRRELAYRSEHDELTGLYNKDSFIRRTRALLDANPETRYVILRVDIDRFKVYNDMFGVQAGDKLLCAFADLIRAKVRPGMVYGRLNADHFIFCFPKAQLHLKADMTSGAAWFRAYSPDYLLQPCFGLYEVDEPEIDVSLMCDRVLLAMRTVKGLYPPRAGIYDSNIREQLLQEQWITTQMRSALRGGDFRLYFQPQFQIFTGQITGAEVLVRWIHPQRGLLSPASFIPIFEKNGFITQLDQYVWAQSCRWIREWLDAGKPPVPLSVNVSRMDVRALDLCEEFHSLTVKYGIPPELLRIEVTESAYMENPKLLISTLHKLQELGFTIEMDDFGSGYSSLNSLKDVPVDVLKLDLKFLSSGDAYGRSATILSSMMNMAKWLDLQVIAEGVETESQRKFLASIACSYGQGYLFSRPIDEEAWRKMLDASEIVPMVMNARREETALDMAAALIEGQKTLLIADDSKINRMQLKKILGDGYAFLEAGDGQEALSILQSGQHVDAALLDIIMPGMSGLDVVRTIRSSPDWQELPTMVMTADDQSGATEEKALDAGASDFVLKPFQPAVIRKRLTSLLLLHDALKLARLDGLTGLLNRTTIRSVVDDWLRRSEGTPRRAAFVTMDIDRFKEANDGHGHAYGDKILVSFATMLRRVCGKDAMIGRLGGDEFMVLLENVGSEEEAGRICDELMAQTRQITFEDSDDHLSCSVGIALYPTDFVHRTDLYAASDAALYEAKRRGKDQYAFYSDLRVPPPPPKGYPARAPSAAKRRQGPATEIVTDRSNA